jgi:hypothetical protein
MAIRDVCSPVNKMKRPAPTSNARPLSNANPKHAHPQERGPKAPASSATIDLPRAK